MQDELFARNVNCVLIIKEGFKLDVVTIPGTQAATTFESAINSFTKTYNTYIASGYSEADALAAVNTSLSQKASVSLLSGKMSPRTQGYTTASVIWDGCSLS